MYDNHGDTRFNDAFDICDFDDGTYQSIALFPPPVVPVRSVSLTLCVCGGGGNVIEHNILHNVIWTDELVMWAVVTHY